MLVEKVEGIKHDAGKIDWSLMLWNELNDVAKVMTYGAVKYEPYNWQKVAAGKNGKERYFAAALRHIVSYKLGKRMDEDTKLNPLSHAVCCLLMLMWADRNIPTIIEPPEHIIRQASKVKNIANLLTVKSKTLSGAGRNAHRIKESTSTLKKRSRNRK